MEVFAQVLDPEKIAASPNWAVYLLTVVLIFCGSGAALAVKSLLGSIGKRDLAFEQQTVAMGDVGASLKEIKGTIGSVCKANCPGAESCANFKPRDK